MTALLAIPCYNCEEQIIRVIDSLHNNSLTGIDQIIFINNLSTDGTLEVIKQKVQGKFTLPCFVIENKENYGLGGSFKLIHHYCLENKLDHLIFMHGDDQADVNDIAPMLEEIKSNQEMAAVLGSRFHAMSTRSGYSLIRTIGNKFLNLLFSIACLRSVSEIGSGLNIYKVNKLQELDVALWPNHIAFDVNILLGLVRRKMLFKFHPINWDEKDQISNAGNFSTALTVLFMLIKWLIRLENKNEKWKTNFKYDKVTL